MDTSLDMPGPGAFSPRPQVVVIGAGLAGSEAAWQAASLGVPVVIHEMRPVRKTDAHHTDGLAELVNKYPDRFVAGVASLPMNNPDAALVEADRAIKDLKLKGVQVLTPTCDKPLDMPEFVPIYAKMAQYDLPVWLHPRRAQSYADYRYEHESKYRIFSVFGWPFETTVAMARIVFSGILEKYPNLKFITHHCGGMVPYFRERVIGSYERIFKDVGDNVKGKLSKPHSEYFRMFYNDTAINGNTSALMCAYEFCGAEHMLFGTDMPFDTEFGARNLRQVSAAIEKMAISEDEKQKIFHGNARRLLRLGGEYVSRAGICKMFF